MATSMTTTELHHKILSQAHQVIPGRLAFLCGPAVELRDLQQTFPHHDFLCIDEEMIYEPFYSDFGPLNMGHTFDFCLRVLRALKKLEGTGRAFYIYSNPHAWYKANAAVLVGNFHMLYTSSTPENTWEMLSALGPFSAFRDASTGPSVMPLMVLDILKGMRAAHTAGFLPWVGQEHLFDLEAYKHYEQVQHGDLNWTIPQKMIAFAGPSRVTDTSRGYKSWMPEDYWGYFSNSNVTDVIRLNNDPGRRGYDPSQFQLGGYNHHDLFFEDGSCPNDDIIEAFMQICESSEGVVAIHCKAGLGRTGVLIGLYLMKHYSFTAKEAIAYLRVCRPGSVIAQQQSFLQTKENLMWQSGQTFRDGFQGKTHRMALIKVAPNGPAAPLVTLPPLMTRAASAALASQSAASLDGMPAAAISGPVARPISAVSAEDPAMSAANSGSYEPPASPAKASMPRAARASPHWMATNGQPRKGYNPATNTATGTSPARKLQFGAGSLPAKVAQAAVTYADEWLIPAVPI